MGSPVHFRSPQATTDPFEYDDGLVMSPQLGHSVSTRFTGSSPHMPQLKAFSSSPEKAEVPAPTPPQVLRPPVPDNPEPPSEGLRLCNVSLTIGEKQILHKISGHVPKGSLCAILGPSGAGKSTLLNVIGKRIKAEGSVAFDASPVSRRNVGYVKQSVKMWDLSVRDVMRFCSDLKLKLPQEKKTSRIDTVMDEVCLADDVYCGNALEGDRKKTSMCVELLSDPSLLLLDEPTSGLDSVSTRNLIESLKKQAGKRTVVATIHQPSSSVFAAFDYLIFLVDGWVAYWGKAAQAEEYFSNAGAPYPPMYNPAEHILAELSRNKQQYIELWQEHAPQVVPSHLGSVDDTHTHTYVGVGLQLRALLWREWKEWRAHNVPWRGRLLRAIVFPLLMILFFFQSDDTPGGVHAKRSIMFLAVLEAIQEPLLDAATTLPAHIEGIYAREVEAGLYSAGPYIVAKVVAECLKLVPLAVAFSSVSYFGAGLAPKAGNFMVFLLMYYTVAVCAFCTAVAFSSALRSALVLVLSPMVIPVMLLTSGHIIEVGLIPEFMRWLSSVSVARYAYDAVVINEFAGRTLTCNATSCFGTGDELIDAALPSTSSVHRSFTFFVLYTFVVLLLSLLLLKFRKLDP